MPKSDDEWLAAYLAGEWIPHAVIAENTALRKRIWEHDSVLSVARDAYRIKSAFSGEQAA